MAIEINKPLLGDYHKYDEKHFFEFIDPEIRECVRLANELRLHTIMSCSGHEDPDTEEYRDGKYKDPYIRVAFDTLTDTADFIRLMAKAFEQGIVIGLVPVKYTGRIPNAEFASTIYVYLRNHDDRNPVPRLERIKAFEDFLGAEVAERNA